MWPQFDPWVGKIPWSRTRQLTAVFLSGESPWTEDPGRLHVAYGVSKSRLDMTEQRSTVQHNSVKQLSFKTKINAWWKQCQTLFFGAPGSLRMVIAAMKWGTLAPWGEGCSRPGYHVWEQGHCFAGGGSVWSRLWFFRWSCVDVRVGL